MRGEGNGFRERKEASGTYLLSEILLLESLDNTPVVSGEIPADAAKEWLTRLPELLLLCDAPVVQTTPRKQPADDNDTAAQSP